MASNRESDFAEVLVDRLMLESFANESSAYYAGDASRAKSSALDQFRSKLKWHIGHSLSERQKQVLHSYLAGKKEREIALDLGVTQQVVNIYKHRAIKKLRKIFSN